MSVLARSGEGGSIEETWTGVQAPPSAADAGPWLGEVGLAGAAGAGGRARVYRWTVCACAGGSSASCPLRTGRLSKAESRGFHLCDPLSLQLRAQTTWV